MSIPLGRGLGRAFLRISRGRESEGPGEGKGKSGGKGDDGAHGGKRR